MQALRLGAVLLLLAGCRQRGQPELDTQNTIPPQVVSTVPPLPDAGVIISWSAGVQVTFSEEMDPDTLNPGIQLFAPPSSAGGTAIQVPVLITRTSGVAPFPPYAESNPSPPSEQPTYLIQQAAGGGNCQTDGGNVGCFEAPANYDLRLLTLLTDTTGLPLPAQVDVLFTTIPR